MAGASSGLLTSQPPINPVNSLRMPPFDAQLGPPPSGAFCAATRVPRGWSCRGRALPHWLFCPGNSREQAHHKLSGGAGLMMLG